MGVHSMGKVWSTIALFFVCKLCYTSAFVYARTVAKCSAMDSNYRQDEHGFYYAESANYHPTGYEFSASVNQFPVDP